MSKDTFDKLFEIALLLLLFGFLVRYSQQGDAARYRPVSNIDDAIFDSKTGTFYLYEGGKTMTFCWKDSVGIQKK